MAIKPTADFGNFTALDIRAGGVALIIELQKQTRRHPADNGSKREGP